MLRCRRKGIGKRLAAISKVTTMGMNEAHKDSILGRDSSSRKSFWNKRSSFF